MEGGLASGPAAAEEHAKQRRDSDQPLVEPGGLEKVGTLLPAPSLSVDDDDGSGPSVDVDESSTPSPVIFNELTTHDTRGEDHGTVRGAATSYRQ
jgi:hypothetical protein